MKNLIIVLFIVMYFITPIGVQAEHNSDNNKLQASVTVKKKDPKLFDKFIVKEINKTQYQQKLSSDNKKYSGIKRQLNNDQYSVYRIFEKILRANNLEYQNWRIGIKRTATNINASAGSANLILINSALYDSLYNDKDALAFVISHETAHFLLNHNKKTGKIVYAINRLERKQYNLEIKSRYDTSSSFSLYYLAGKQTINARLALLYKKLRTMEYEADREALSLMARAGFNTDNAINTIEFLDKLLDVGTVYSTHPNSQDRINNINKELSILDIQSLVNQGKSNIYNSDVITIKKSTDRYTFVMNEQKKSKSNYIADSKDNKLMLKGYSYYLKDDMEQAELYFKEAFKCNKTNYMPTLYLSYINEYNYMNSNDLKVLKKAYFWIKKAKKLSPYDKNIISQEKDILLLLNDR